MLHVPYGYAEMVYLCRDTLLSRFVLKMGFKRVGNGRYLKVRHLEIRRFECSLPRENILVGSTKGLWKNHCYLMYNLVPYPSVPGTGSRSTDYMVSLYGSQHASSPARTTTLAVSRC